MAKPSIVPTWATDPGAQIIEPSGARRSLGWVPGDRPPAQEFNWWQNAVGQWVDWLDQRFVTIGGGAGVGLDVDQVEAGYFVGRNNLRLGDPGPEMRQAFPDANTVTPLSSILTVDPGWTLGAAVYRRDQFTRWVYISGVIGSRNSAILASDSNITIGTLAASYRPTTQAAYGAALIFPGPTINPPPIALMASPDGTLSLRKNNTSPGGDIPASMQVVGTLVFPGP